jgi:chemotaxis protein CheD
VCFVPATGKAIVRKLRAQTEVAQVQNEEGELLRRLSGLRAAPAAATKGNP